LKHKLSNPPVLAFPDTSLPFILSTDASQVGLDAVLSQIRDGIKRPIAYDSRQLNKAEWSYSASEVEALAVVWETKYFRCYLYGKKFLVRTDHAALRYLHKFSDCNIGSCDGVCGLQSLILISNMCQELGWDMWMLQVST
jgi:hypothetical protein